MKDRGFEITSLPNGYAQNIEAQVPPQATDLEEAVLGACLVDKDAFVAILDILAQESFYHDAHGFIFKAMLELFGKSLPIDMLTVGEELKKMGCLERIGGHSYLAKITNRVASSANVEYHAQIVRQKFILRELIRASAICIKNAFDPSADALELLDESEKTLFSVAQGQLNRSVSKVSQTVCKAMQEIEISSQQKDGLTGVPSGFLDIDRVTRGWQSSDLIIIAARPGMGKTSFVLNMALNAAEIGKGVAIFSLEMGSVQLTKRLLSIESEVDSKLILSGQMEEVEWQQIGSASESLAMLPIYIDDTPGINPFELRAKCRRLKMQHDIQMVVIDYLQLMSGAPNKNGGNREQEISQISRSLKGMAKELNVPVIALSQLSRAVETRGGTKRPQLSDLRESGAIEQDADIVSFIYRPEYYQILEDEEGQSLRGVAEIIIAKHRNGALKTVQLKWIDRLTKFEDMDDDDFGPEYSGLSEGSSQYPSDNRIIRRNSPDDDDLIF